MASRYWDFKYQPNESSFVPLPLDLMQQQLDRKAAKEEELKSKVYALGDDQIQSEYIRQTPDEKRVLGIQSEYKDRRDKLMNNLLSAKTEADIQGLSRGIIETNRWKQDMLKPTGELGTIAANKRLYDEQLASLDKSKLLGETKELAKQKLLEEFKKKGGTAYDPLSKNYNLVNQYSLPEDVDLRETAQKIAKDIETQKYDIGGIWKNNGEWMVKNSEGKEFRLKEVIANTVNNTLKHDPKVRDYVQFAASVGQDLTPYITNLAMDMGDIYKTLKTKQDQDIRQSGEQYQSGVNRANKIMEEEQTFRTPIENMGEDVTINVDELLSMGYTGKEGRSTDKVFPFTAAIGTDKLRKESPVINYKTMSGQTLNQMLSGTYKHKTDPTANAIQARIGKNEELKNILINMSNKYPSMNAEELIKRGVNNYNQLANASSKFDNVAFVHNPDQQDYLKRLLVGDYDRGTESWKEGQFFKTGKVKVGNELIPLEQYITDKGESSMFTMDETMKEKFLKTATVNQLTPTNKVAPGSYIVEYTSGTGKKEKIVVQDVTQEQNIYAKGLWKANQVIYDPKKTMSEPVEVVIPDNRVPGSYNKVTLAVRKKYNWVNANNPEVESSKNDPNAVLKQGDEMTVEYVKIDPSTGNPVVNAAGEFETYPKGFIDHGVNKANPFRAMQSGKVDVTNAAVLRDNPYKQSK